MSYYIKILKKGLLHHGFQYKLGLNTDCKKWTDKECDNGLHFCRVEDFADWIEYGELVANVKIPSNAKVIHYSNKSKASAISLSNIRPIKEFLLEQSYETIYCYIERSPSIIKYIDGADHKLLSLAIKKYPIVIQYISNPPEFLCTLAIYHDPYTINRIKDPSDELKIMAIHRNGLVISLITNPTYLMKQIAVRQNGLSIGCILYPTEELCMMAIDENPYCIRYITNPSEEICKYALKKNPACICVMRDIPNISNIVKQLEIE